VTRALQALLICCALAVAAGQPQNTAQRLIAIFVVDGLRPDSINDRDSPALARLRREGSEYINSHSTFPTVTRLNTATLATGAYPALHGIVGNSMFAPAVNERAPFDTGDYTQLLKLENGGGRAVTTDTLGEVLFRSGKRLVTMSSASTGNGYLLNPAARRGGAGVAIHGLLERGVIAGYPKDTSDAVIKRFGLPPPDPDDLGQMEWTDNVLREYVLPELKPDVLIDWMGPLDSAQHVYGVGSPEALSVLHQVDASLARTLARIDALGLRNRTDVIVTSDHGFARYAEGVNIVDALVAAGLKKSADSTDIIVASQLQSVLFYLPGAGPDRIEALVRFLQRQPWADVLFTRGGQGGRGGVSGTFSLDLVKSAHPSRSPDVVVTFPYSSERNAFGVAGAHTIYAAAAGPLRGAASGHGGLSPWVVRNTLLAWGVDFNGPRRFDEPASLADLAPTVLTVLGIAPPSGEGRGRVLHELLKNSRVSPNQTVSHREIDVSAGAYGATLMVSSVAGHDYVDSGSRRR